MLNSIDNKNNCPLKFSYDTFGNWYTVGSDVWQDIEDKRFLGSAGVTKLQKLCTWQEKCDHTTCEYQKELVRALFATTTSFDPRKSVEDNK